MKKLKSIIFILFFTLIAATLKSYSQTGGSLMGNFSVNAQGGANYQLPVEVPPGLQSITPKLSIVYSSQSGNGILGEGFAIQGLSAISRSGATIAQDGFTGGINYNGLDRFSLDGKRLMVIDGNYGAAGSTYNTQVQSWTKIIANGDCGGGPCSFTVILKSGITLEYGFTSDAQVKANGAAFDNGPQQGVVRKWLLNKVTDLNGNYATYQYSSSPTNAAGVAITTDAGQAYLTQISYTGNANLSPQRFIHFYYENRPDSSLQYLGGGIIETTARLSSIETEIILPNGKLQPVITYSFSYNSNSLIGTSLLSEIKVSDGNGVCLPTQTFDWTTGANGFTKVETTYTGDLNNEGWVGDFNGDGLTDILTYNENQNALDSLYFSTGEAFAGGVYVGSVYLENMIPYIADFNADGLSDIIGLGLDEAMVWLCNGNGFNAPIDVGEIESSSGKGNLWLEDFNGDGRADLFLEYGYEFLLYLSTGSTFQDPITLSPSLNTSQLCFGDFNGDGLTDIYTAYESGVDSLYFSNFSKGTDFLPAVPVSTLNYTSDSWVSDFNKDGLDDILIQYGNDGYLNLSSGNGFEKALVISELEFGNAGNWVGDYNGDGLTDLFVNGSGADSSTLYLYQNGKGLVPTTKIPAMELSSSNVWIGDFNGDGTTDLFSAQLSPVFLLSSNTGDTEITQNHLPNMLTSIDNGIGARVNISYLPITDTTIYNISAQSNDGTISGTQSLNRYHSNAISNTYTSCYPIQATQSATYVVDKYQIINGKTDSVTYYYAYEGAKVDLRGYGWLGYKSVSKIDSLAGRILEQKYHQVFPLTGSTQNNAVYTLNNELMGTESVSYELIDSIYSNETVIHNVRKTGLKKEYYDYGIFAYALETTCEYDQFNNPKLIQKRDLSDSLEVLYIVNTYLNDTANWHLSYLLESVYAQDSLATQKLSGIRYAYHPTTMDTIVHQQWIQDNNWLGTAFLHDQYGNVTATINQANDTAFTQYDSFYHTFISKRVSMPNANGERLEVNLHFDPRFGLVDSLINPNGYLFHNKVDGFGRDSAVYIPNPNGESVLYQTSTYALNPNGGLIKTNANLTNWETASFDTVKTFYDPLLRNCRTMSEGFDGKWVYKDILYDMTGQVKKGSFPYYEDSTAYWTTLQYDPYSRVIEVTHPLSPTDSITYKTVYQGQSIYVHNASIPDSVGTKVFFTTRNGNRCFTQLVDENLDTMFFDYDLIGQTKQVYNNQFTVNSTTYDGIGRTLTSDNISLGKTKFEYNDIANTILQITANGDSIFTKNDALSRPIYQKYSNGDSLILEYDLPTTSNGKGELCRVIMSPDLSYGYSYLPTGNNDSIWLNIGTETFVNVGVYDPNQNLTSTIFPNGSIQKSTYSADYFLESIEYINPLADTITMLSYTDYLANGSANKMIYGNGVQLNEEFLFNNQLSQITLQDAANDALLSITYNWNKQGQIDTITRSGGISEKVAYSYDLTGRLLTADSPDYDLNFEYDGIGNFIQNESITIDYDHFQPSVVTNQAGDTLEKLTYDLQGNLIEKQVYFNQNTDLYQYSYDLWNMLTAVRLNGDTINQYSYNYNGELLMEDRKLDSTTILYPFAGYSITRNGENEKTDITISDNTRLIGVVSVVGDSPENITYYHQNNVGSTVLTTNTAGETIEEIAYTPYGGVSQRISNDTSATYLFDSKEYAESTELYNFSARYYNPHLGRFTSADNQLGGNPWQIDAYNNYCFALNNPIKYADPSGHSPEEDMLDALVGLMMLGGETILLVLTDGTATPEIVMIDDAAFGAMEAAEGTADMVDVIDLTGDESEDIFMDSETESETENEYFSSSSSEDDAMEDWESSSDEEEDDPDDPDYDDGPEPSKRSQYMGSTPGKTSTTGRQVIQRMTEEGKIRVVNGSNQFLASDGKWYDFSQGDMSHIKAAVDWWNETGRFTGAKSNQVREFMRDYTNYYLEYKRINRAEGGAMKARYLKPTK